MIPLIRLATYGLLAAGALVAVFDEQAVSLSLGLLLLAMTGVLILTVRRRARQQRGSRP
jgi:hypothetical protein